MEGTQFEIGKIYEIDHSRKGRFSIRVEEQGEDYLEGVVVDGYAAAMMSYDVKEEGEKVRMRKSLINRATEAELDLSEIKA
jgi:hypothetical protein